MKDRIIFFIIILYIFPILNLHSQNNNTYDDLKKETILKVIVLPFADISTTKNPQYTQLTKALPLMIAGEYANCIRLNFLPPKRAENYYQETKHAHKQTLDEYKKYCENLDVDIIIHGNYIIDNDKLKLVSWVYFKKQNASVQVDESGNLQTHFYQLQKSFVDKIGNVLGLKLDISQLKSSCGGFYRSLILLIDASGSMKDDNKLNYAKSFAKEVLSSLSANTEATVLTFSGDHCYPDPLNVIYPFSNNFEALKLSLDNIKPGGGTPLSNAMEKAIDYLEANHRGKTGHIILLSDGQDDCRKIGEALKIINKSIIPVELDAVGIDIDKDSTAELDLKTVAGELSGDYYKISTLKDIKNEVKPVINNSSITNNNKPKSHPIIYMGY